MARQTKAFEFDDLKFKVKQLPTDDGVPLGHRLIKAIGPSIRSFIGGLKPEEIDIDIDSMTAEKLLTTDIGIRMVLQIVQAFEDMPTPLLQDLCHAMRDSTTVSADGGKIFVPLGPVYDDTFAGRYETLGKLLMGFAKLNFAGFFSNLKRSAKQAQPETTDETTA